MTLSDFFRENPRAAVAFSGGVDSAYLLYAAREYGAQVRAYYVKSTFQPEFELADARRLARELSVPMTVLELDVLADPQIQANPKNRCYFCKKAILGRILSAAAADGFSLLLDGTNASDEAGDRPGMRALAELQVCSPLRLAGLTKREIRERSHRAGLFTWDKPAFACLATRIPAGTPLDAQKLAAVERAEGELMTLGFRDLRARVRGTEIWLEVLEEQLPLVEEMRGAVTACLSRAFPDAHVFVKVRQTVT